MSDRVAFLDGRAFPRLALTGLALIWLSGCARQRPASTSSNPFSNPFDSKTARRHAALGRRAARPGRRRAAARRSGVASATFRRATSTAKQAVGGSAPAGPRSAARRSSSPQGETLDTLSRRYGVPTAALLSANGLSSSSDVKGGMRMVVPVYNAGGRAVAAAPADKARRRGLRQAAPKTLAERCGDERRRKPKKTKSDAKDQDAEEQTGQGGKAESDARVAAISSQKTRRSRRRKPRARRRQERTPAKPPAAGQEGRSTRRRPAMSIRRLRTPRRRSRRERPTRRASTPEFRWPARGRIIEGFKAGGNDGINISVPAGTSVRAAENGVVVYSGDGLKGYGNLVLIKHPNGFVSAYANNGELDVKRGDTVKRGQIIAKSGDTGNVNAPAAPLRTAQGLDAGRSDQLSRRALEPAGIARSSLQSGIPNRRCEASARHV